MNTTIEILSPVAFQMKDKDKLSIIEACCYLRLSLKKFRKFRNELNIHPVSKAKPYIFRQKDVNNTLVTLLAARMLGLDRGIKCDTLLSPEEFYDHHLHLAAIHYCHTGALTLARLFMEAEKIHKLLDER